MLALRAGRRPADTPSRRADAHAATAETRRAAVVWTLAAVAVLVASQAGTAARGAVGVVGLVVIGLVALSGRTLALSGILVWLVLLGFIRRFLIPFIGWSNEDPLLLVGPAVAALLWYFGRQQRIPRTLLSSVAGFLLLWAVAGILNPNEAELSVAARGALFYVGPLLWFFAGRTLTGAQRDRVLDTVFWMNLPVLALGLYHSFIGFLPFEYTWVGVSGQGESIFFPGFRVRPFSTLVSPQEYGVYLAFSAQIIWARVLDPARARHRRWLLLFLGITMVGLFLQASRSIFLFCLLAFAVTAVVRLRSLGGALAVGAVVALLVVLAGRAEVDPHQGEDEDAPGRVAVLVLHQLSGITNPGQSTAPVHLDLIANGFAEGIRDPFGLGVSHNTLAQAKDRPEDTTSAESDIAATTAGLGIPGGFALAIIIVVGLGAAVQLELAQASARHLAWLGIFVAGLNQWMSGALYCTSAILWLCLGGVAREIGERLAERPRERA